MPLPADLTEVPEGTARTRFDSSSVKGLAVQPAAGRLLSWLNTDASGEPVLEAEHYVEALPEDAQRDRIALQIPMSLSPHTPKDILVEIARLPDECIPS